MYKRWNPLLVPTLAGTADEPEWGNLPSACRFRLFLLHALRRHRGNDDTYYSRSLWPRVNLSWGPTALCPISFANSSRNTVTLPPTSVISG